MFGDQPARQPVTGQLHHVEIWIPSLEQAVAQWGWLLSQLGYQPFQEWSSGRSWRLGCYLVFEQSAAATADDHDRCRPGLNHIAFHYAAYLVYADGYEVELVASPPGHSNVGEFEPQWA